MYLSELSRNLARGELVSVKFQVRLNELRVQNFTEPSFHGSINLVAKTVSINMMVLNVMISNPCFTPSERREITVRENSFFGLGVLPSKVLCISSKNSLRTQSSKLGSKDLIKLAANKMQLRVGERDQ